MISSQQACHILVSRLEAIRKSARRRLIAYGAFAVPAGGFAALVTIIAVDWALLLPAVLRIVVTMFFIAGFLGATWYWILAPLQAKIDRNRIAVELERRFPRLGEHLSSSLSFLNEPAPHSPGIVRKVFDETNAMLQEVPLESMFSVRPLILRGLLLGLAVAAFASLAWTAPNWLATGVDRYWAPFGPVEWPRRVSIVPLTEELTVAVGDSATVAMRIERGGYEGLRSLVRLRQTDGNVTTRTLQEDAEGRLTATIDSVTSTLVYWFEAGDDSTQFRSGRIQVVQRPEIIGATATITPPPYAFGQIRPSHDLATGPVQAPIGGSVVISIRSSKPIPADSAAYGGLALDPRRWLPLAPDPVDPTLLSAALDVMGDESFRVDLVDDLGFANRGSPRYSIQSAPDAPPVIKVLEPIGDVERTAAGSLDLVVQADDDFGLKDLRLATVRQSDGRSVITPLLEGSAAPEGQERRDAKIRHRWSVDALSPAPGDVLVQTVEAVDNRPADIGGPQTGRSAPLRIRIISEGDFLNRWRDELAALEERIRRAALDEGDVLDLTLRIAETKEGHVELEVQEREATRALVTRQARLVRRVEEIARRFDELADQSRQNSASGATGMDQAALGNVLRQIARGSMSAASEALLRALQTDGPPAVSTSRPSNLDPSPGVPAAEGPRETLREAAREEDDAVKRLQSLLVIMSQWGTFQGLANKTRDLLDRQNAILTKTLSISQSTLGKPQDTLTPEETADLKQTQRRQEQLAGDVEQHLARMSELLSSPSTQRDAADREAIESALRAAKAKDLIKKLRNSAESVALNRTAAATVDQRGATEAMRAMVEALAKRDRRQLEMLRKDLARWAELLEGLIQEQEQTQANVKAFNLPDEVGRVTSIAQEQRRIRNNTRLFADELAEQSRLAPAVRPLRDAVAMMTKAEDHLRTSRPQQAVDRQDEALGFLRDALSRLQEMDAVTAAEAFLRSLGELRDELEAVLVVQKALQESLVRLLEGMKAGSQSARPAARESSKLAVQQEENRKRVEELLPQVENVVVYSDLLNRVSEWMERIESQLDARRPDEDTLRTCRRVISKLETLVAALAETLQLPRNEEFAEADGGAGGGSGGASSGARPIPPIAELLVLKAMQLEIKERTRGLGAEQEPHQLTEQTLQNVRLLAEDQDQLRHLAERLFRGNQPEGVERDP